MHGVTIESRPYREFRTSLLHVLCLVLLLFLLRLLHPIIDKGGARMEGENRIQFVPRVDPEEGEGSLFVSIFSRQRRGGSGVRRISGENSRRVGGW